jgi:1-acyl-sn-glycerol-3-phosphate acyltransferase
MIAAVIRRAIRLPLLVVLLFGGLFTVLMLFPLMREGMRRATVRRWSRLLVAACGIRPRAISIQGAHSLAQLSAGSLVVANHISWLDIFVINSQCPCSFVAKDEILRWPLIGTLVARTGTLFIERGKRHSVHRMIEHIQRKLLAGGRVAVFPEGTTGEGDRLLPFHANLIEGALRAGASVVPVGLSYRDRDGGRSSAVEFVGDTSFIESMWRIIGAPTVHCEVQALAGIDAAAGQTRHEVSQIARQQLARALHLPLDDLVPENLRVIRERKAAQREALALDAMRGAAGLDKKASDASTDSSTDVPAIVSVETTAGVRPH